MKTQRFFAGNTLPQALMAAARYHGLSPDELSYQPREKRHGFVHRVRRFIIEVDPQAPRRAQHHGRVAPAPAASPVGAPQRPMAEVGEAPLPSPAPLPLAPRPARSGPEGPRPLPVHAEASTAAAVPSAAGRTHGPSQVEPFLPPDEESVLAASVAMGTLLALARLELTVRVERRPDRLLIALGGPDEELLRDLGEDFLDDLEHLVPRAIRGLAGRMVRCKVEGAGLRSARELELRELAENAAAQAVASGEAILLEPLSAADRRIVHLALVDDVRVTTESQGLGAEKRVRVALVAPGAS